MLLGMLCVHRVGAPVLTPGHKGPVWNFSKLGLFLALFWRTFQQEGEGVRTTLPLIMQSKAYRWRCLSSRAPLRGAPCKMPAVLSLGA